MESASASAADRREASARRPSFSLVVPVYNNADSIPALLERLRLIAGRLPEALEAVFVVDGSPDSSHAQLAERLADFPLESQLIMHSRNFGSFAATRTGLQRARGREIAVMAADLQEPPELIVRFFSELDAGADLVIGRRVGRSDPRLSALGSRLFWALYRRLVWRDMPPGGVDVFACSERFAEKLLDLEESNSSLVTLALWLGFERVEVPYERLRRESGSSGWSFRRKLRYVSDSVYSFTDLPIRLLRALGIFGICVSILIGAIVGIARAGGAIDVPGYTATILVVSFFAAINLFGLGIIGAYVWRAYENTKNRPDAVVMSERFFPAENRTP